AEHAVHRAGIDAQLHAIARTGDEGQDVLAPLRTATEVRSQVHHRAVAAGAGDQVTVDALAGADHLAGLGVDGADPRAADPLAAQAFHHRAASEDAHAAAARLVDPVALRVAARIGDRGHFQA